MATSKLDHVPGTVHPEPRRIIAQLRPSRPSARMGGVDFSVSFSFRKTKFALLYSKAFR
jgi:hypothetical protein